MTGYDDLMKDTNGPAYKKEEKRVGPPLEYVGEKIRKALESEHALLRNIIECVPDNLPLAPCYQEGAPISIKHDCLESLAHYSFHNLLIAFAALYNMLSSVGESGDVERFLKMGKEEFARWLNLIEREGSVVGRPA